MRTLIGLIDEAQAINAKLESSQKDDDRWQIWRAEGFQRELEDSEFIYQIFTVQININLPIESATLVHWLN